MFVNKVDFKNIVVNLKTASRRKIIFCKFVPTIQGASSKEENSDLDFATCLLVRFGFFDQKTEEKNETCLIVRGTRGAAMEECSAGLDPSPDCGNQRIGPGPGLDLSEVVKPNEE